MIQQRLGITLIQYDSTYSTLILYDQSAYEKVQEAPRELQQEHIKMSAQNKIVVAEGKLVKASVHPFLSTHCPFQQLLEAMYGSGVRAPCNVGLQSVPVHPRFEVIGVVRPARTRHSVRVLEGGGGEGGGSEAGG